jgi:hypothetical protein
MSTPGPRPHVDPDLRAHMLRTYAALRALMAVVTLAFLLNLLGYRVLGHEPGRTSVSAYYYHDDPADWRMKDVFVGALCTVGFLLIAYQGYSDAENRALNAAGTCLLCVVVFPMDPDTAEKVPRSFVGTLHYVFAVLFFAGLFYVCVFRARDTLYAARHPYTRLYAQLYRLTGGLMAVLPPLAIGLYFARREDAVFWVECFGVTVFLAFWLIKSVELRHPVVVAPAGVPAAPKLAPAMYRAESPVGVAVMERDAQRAEAARVVDRPGG